MEKYMQKLIQQNALILAEQEKNKVLTERLWGELLYLNLGSDKVINFNYHGTEIKLWLPYAQSDYIQSRILREKTFFESSQLEGVRQYLTHESVVVDAGANIGNHTVFFNKICGVKQIYCFEPQDVVRKILQRNIDLNNCTGVTVFPVALGRIRGTVSLSEFRSNNLGATRFTASDRGLIEMIALDDLEIPKLDFLKVDIEGGQYEFLLGAEKTIRRFKPKIFIELLQEKGEFKETNDLLLGWGFKGHQIDKHNHIYLV